MDLFLGADFVYPEKIVAAGLADGTAPTQYARGTLVLWARKDSPLQPITLDSLVDKRVTTVAIAERSACSLWTGGGGGAEADEDVRHRQAAPRHRREHCSSGAVCGVGQCPARANLADGCERSSVSVGGTFLRVPRSSYAPIMRCAVVIAKSDRRAEAHAFLDWLLKPQVQAALAPMGLEPVK